MAQFAELAYVMNDKKLNKSQRIDKISKQIPEGYTIHPASNKDVQLYINPESKHGVIAHRGTDFNGRKIGKDLKADLAYIAGAESQVNQFKKRSNKTKQLIKKIDEELGKDSNLTLVGHSYGASSINNTLLKEPSVRNRVDNVELYNPLIHNTTSKLHTKSNEKKSDVDDQLNKLITIHRTKNDLVSASKPQHGKVKNYKQKYHSTKKTNPFVDMFDKVEQLSAHSIKNFI